LQDSWRIRRAGVRSFCDVRRPIAAGAVRLELRSAAAPLAALALLAALTATPAGATGSRAPRTLASVARACNLSGHEQSLGPTYVTYLGASGGASCGRGMRLVRAYFRCRIKHGGVRGHCGGVEGFHCTESRYLSIAVQFDARVLCLRGSERVRHNFTQFT
jgi:hypothetical protein